MNVVNPKRLTILINVLIANKATMNEIIPPMNNGRIWVASKVFASLKSLYKVAAVIVGTARKNENSVASFLFIPRVRPPTMVAPDLETPGIAKD